MATQPQGSGSKAVVMTGARAKVAIGGNFVGVFSMISYGLNYGADPIFILGSYGPKEIVYTSQEVVSIQASGWRVIDNGPHMAAQMPTLDKLLNHQDIEITVFDRLTNKTIAKFHNCRPISYNTSLNNKQAAEISVNFLGLKLGDESFDGTETPNASTLT